MKNYTILIIIGLAAALAISVNQCRENAKQGSIARTNTEALLHSVRFYKASDSTNAASVERLRLTIDQLEDSRGRDAEAIAALKIKLNRVQSISTTATETKYEIKTQIRDSIVYRDGKPKTIPCIDYRDRFITIAGCTEGGTYSGTIEVRDTIHQIVHRVPRRFLFFKFGTKSIRQEVKNSNPHTKISYTEYIELEKNR